MNIFPAETVRDLDATEGRPEGPLPFVALPRSCEPVVAQSAGVARFALNADRLARAKELLTESQYALLIDIYDRWATGAVCCTLDAGPGTGKTFLVNVLMNVTRQKCAYVVYSRNLAHSMNARNPPAECGTVCSFICKTFKLSFCETLSMFSGELNVVLRRLVELVRDSKRPDVEVLICDEYSVLSPMCLLLLALLVRRWDARLLLVGDGCQQRSLNAHRAHPHSNRSFVIGLGPVFTLAHNVRQRDDARYQRLVETLKSWVRAGRRLDLSVKYDLYRLIPEKFHEPSSAQNIYLSQFHRRIKRRVEAIAENFPHEKAYFVKKRTGERLGPNDKFCHFVPLIKNMQYVHTDAGVRHPVTLIAWNAQRVLVRFNKDGRKKILSRRPCSANNTILALLQEVQGYEQFPLALPSFTIHAVQGLTLECGQTQRIEVDLDARSTEALYVALTRGTRLSELGRLHTRFLDALRITHERGDGFLHAETGSTQQSSAKRRIIELSEWQPQADVTSSDLLRATGRLLRGAACGERALCARLAKERHGGSK